MAHAEQGERAGKILVAPKGSTKEARMIRPHLLAWQWDDYAAKHGPRNLLVHTGGGALFQAGTLFLWSASASGPRSTLASASRASWPAS